MLQETSSIEVYNVIRVLSDICKRIQNVIDSIIVNRNQVKRLYTRLKLFIVEFEKLLSDKEKKEPIPNIHFNNIKVLFLQIASHIETYVTYGPFKKLISNHELEVAIDKLNNQLVMYSYQLGLRNLPFLNVSVKENNDKMDREEDNKNYNDMLEKAMKRDASLLTFLGRVDKEAIIEAISTLEDIINEDIVDPESMYSEDNPPPVENDDSQVIKYSKENSDEILKIIRNYKKPRMNRKKYVNIDNVVYVYEHFKKMAYGLPIQRRNWQIASWDIEIWEVLSNGVFSSIYKAFWLGKDVAIKKMSYQITRVRVRDEYYKDVKMWYSLKHPNVLMLYGAYLFNDCPCVVIPLMKNGNLISYIDGKEKLSLINLIEILIGISSGMEYLHSKNVVHGDLMARNILLDENLQPHICDFGFSKCRAAVADHHSKSKRLDSLRWTANEVHEKFIYTKKSDVYSFAMLCYELFTWGNVPFQNLTDKFISEAVIEGRRPDYPEECPMSIWRLMQKMWDQNPDERPTFTDITNYLCQYKDYLKQQAIQEGIYSDDHYDQNYRSMINNNNNNINNNDNNSIPSTDSQYRNSNLISTNNIGEREGKQIYGHSNQMNYQRSPGCSPHLFNIDDGSGSGSIDLNSSVSPTITKYSPYYTDVNIPSISSAKSINIPYMKSNSSVLYNNGNNQGQAHSLGNNYNYNQPGFPNSPSNNNGLNGMTMHPLQYTSEMYPERFSSKQIHNSNSILNAMTKPLNVVQSGYRQVSTSTNSNGATVLSSSHTSPNLLSPNEMNNKFTNGNIRPSNTSSNSNPSIKSNNNNNNLKGMLYTDNRYYSPEGENINEYSQPDYNFKDIEDDTFSSKIYLTRTEHENIYQDNWNDSSDDEKYYNNFNDDYTDEGDYIDHFSQPNFNEIEDYDDSPYNKVNIGISSLIDNDEDNYPFMNQFDDFYINNDLYNAPIYTGRRSSQGQNQGLSIDTLRRSRSRSRSHTSNFSGSMKAHSRSRSRSRSKSRTRSKSTGNGKRQVMEMEPLEVTNGIVIPSLLTPASSSTRKLSLGTSYSSSDGISNYNMKYGSQSQSQSQGGQSQGFSQNQVYNTPPDSRPHTPLFYDDNYKDNDTEDNQNQNQTQNQNQNQNQNQKLNQLMKNMKINNGEKGNNDQMYIDSSSSLKSKYYPVPRFTNRKEGIYKCEYKKDISFSFMDYEDLSEYYPKDEYCLSNLKFPGVELPEFNPTFTCDIIEQICKENPIEEKEKIDFVRELLLEIYTNEFKNRFGEFKFKDIFRKNRIEVNTYVFITDWSYKRSGYKVLIDIIKYTHIKHIYIRNCRFGDPAIVALAKALIHNNEFTIVDITFCSKRSRPQQENTVMDIIKHDISNLDPTWILNTDVTIKSGQLFAEFAHNNNNLVAFHLRNAAFGDECAVMFANVLYRNKSLEDFELTNCEVREKGAIAFAEMLNHNKTLVRFILDQNNLGDNGAIAISTALRKNKYLKYLLLRKCGFTSKGISSFTPTFLNNLVLEIVKFSNNNIGNEGAKAIAEGIYANKSIRELWIDDCNIGKKGVQAISRVLEQNQTNKSNAITNIHVGSVLKFWEKNNFNSNIIIHKDLYN